MTDTDMAALLRDMVLPDGLHPFADQYAARLIAAGVGFRDEIDVERLARALNDGPYPWDELAPWAHLRYREQAAAIAREYAKEAP